MLQLYEVLLGGTEMECWPWGALGHWELVRRGDFR